MPLAAGHSAPAFSFPLRSGDDQTYDWKFQLQFNYYFGGPVGTPTFVRGG
jgi:hypothetical protein